jgi:hypothetical protein
MKKLAVFVEGYTEVVFVEKLIEEIAGEAHVLIEHREIRGGTSRRRTFAQVRASKPNTGQKYFVMIVDCGGDHLVKTRILEEHDNLTKAGYAKVIGLRDVRPSFTRADIPRLEVGLRTYIKTSLIPVEIFLAILEIEAWFLAEATHFPKIDPAITVAAIRATLGFDPENDDMEQRLTPADDMNDCYAIGGKAYVKANAQATVDALEYSEIYILHVDKFLYLKKLCQSIESFLGT